MVYADWVGDLVDCQSHIGCLVYVGDTMVSWCLKKQTTISKSSTKLEMREISMAMAKLDCVAALLSKLCILVTKPYI